MQIHYTHPDHICCMIMEEITGDFQSDGIKKYIKNLVNYGIKSNGFYSMKKEIKDRITLIEYCNTGCRLDIDSSRKF